MSMLIHRTSKFSLEPCKCHHLHLGPKAYKNKISSSKRQFICIQGPLFDFNSFARYNAY